MNGVWLLPTKGRIDNLRRFLTAARETATDTPGWVLVNHDELERDRASYELAMRVGPPGWELRPVEAECYGDALRFVWDDVKDMDWVGLVSDDLVPTSSKWDTQLLSGLQRWNFISSNDGWQASADIRVGRMHGATAWSGAILRAAGWLMPPGLRHIFHDDVWETLGRETGSWQTRMDVLVKHLHEALQGVRGPTMDPTSALWQHDQAVFEAWRSIEKDAAVARIRRCMDDAGVTMMQPDFAGVTLMIGVPSHSGAYEGHFMDSLFQTLQMMAANGVQILLSQEKYTADISLARANIFSTFVRSSATHLLMIDADMGWSTDAVVRLFCARKDFVSIAGPKKRYPLQFAASHTDAEGNPIDLAFDRTTGTMEVSEVGAAFTLITRSCAERIAQAYPMLEADNVNGEKNWHVFNPLVADRKSYQEDFAFCKRWRDVGGTVHIVPDMALKHTGSHTFEGAFIQAGKTG